MRLVHLQEMDEKQGRALKLGLAMNGAWVDRDEIVHALDSQIVAIDPGIKLVDRSFPIGELGVFDFMGLDGEGRLLAIDVVGNLDVNTFASSIEKFNWVLDNLGLMDHLYGHNASQRTARLVIFAAAIAKDVRALLKFMSSGNVELFLCNKVNLHDDEWLVAHRYAAADAFVRLADVEAVQPVVKKSSTSGELLKSLLSDEEIDDFWRPSGVSNGVEDEVTAWCRS